MIAIKTDVSYFNNHSYFLKAKNIANKWFSVYNCACLKLPQNYDDYKLKN
jgi:hypothetical protein